MGAPLCSRPRGASGSSAGYAKGQPPADWSARIISLCASAAGSGKVQAVLYAFRSQLSSPDPLDMEGWWWSGGWGGVLARAVFPRCSSSANSQACTVCGVHCVWGCTVCGGARIWALVVPCKCDAVFVCEGHVFHVCIWLCMIMCVCIHLHDSVSPHQPSHSQMLCKHGFTLLYTQPLILAPCCKAHTTSLFTHNFFFFFLFFFSYSTIARATSHFQNGALCHVGMWPASATLYKTSSFLQER